MTFVFPQRCRHILHSPLSWAVTADCLACASARRLAPHGLQTTRKDAGTPKSTDVTLNPTTGVVDQLRRPSTSPTTRLRRRCDLGQALFLQNCASCHGTRGERRARERYQRIVPRPGGLGPATIDVWPTRSIAPRANVRAVQAIRHTPAGSPRTRPLAIAAWVNSLSPSYPDIPHGAFERTPTSRTVRPSSHSTAPLVTRSKGRRRAGEHTSRPSLRNIPAFEVVEARANRSREHAAASRGNLSDQQVGPNIVKYVTTEDPAP